MAVPGIGRRTAEAVQAAIAEPPPEADTPGTDGGAPAAPSGTGTALAPTGLVAS